MFTDIARLRAQCEHVFELLSCNARTVIMRCKYCGLEYEDKL